MLELARTEFRYHLLPGFSPLDHSQATLLTYIWDDRVKPLARIFLMVFSLAFWCVPELLLAYSSIIPTPQCTRWPYTSRNSWVYTSYAIFIPCRYELKLQTKKERKKQPYSRKKMENRTKKLRKWWEDEFWKRKNMQVKCFSCLTREALDWKRYSWV